MKAKYFKIYASKYLKEVDKEMGFVKEIDNNLFFIYKFLQRILLKQFKNYNYEQQSD